MNNRFTKIGVTLAIVLILLFLSSKVFTPTENLADTDEEVKSQLNVKGFKISGITFYGNQVLAMLEEKGVKKLYIGDHQQTAIDNVLPWADFQVPNSLEKTYQGVEVNPDAHLLYLFGKKEDGSNFIEFINIATKETVNEIAFEHKAKISNIKFKNAYMEGMLYAKTNQEEQKGEIIFNTTEFNSPMDLLVVDLPSNTASVDWVDATPELEYILYTIKDQGKTSVYVHDSKTKKTTQLKKVSGDKFLFDGEQLIGFKSDKNELAIETYKYSQTTE